MLQINNFSTLFEIAASLNVAFIAVEYATTYTESVAKNVFKFFDKIQYGINLCRKHIDSETIENLDDVKINGHSINYKIQKVKRESEKISKEVEQLSESLNASVREKCQLKCFSMVCFHLFLYCLTAAMVGAYEVVDKITSVEIFWIVFSVMSFSFILLSFIWGEMKNEGIAFLQNIKCNLIVYGGILISSYIIAHMIDDVVISYVDSFWNGFVAATAIYPYVFFVLFIWVLKRNSKSINDDIDKRIGELEQKCIKLEDEVKRLYSVKELSIEVEGMLLHDDDHTTLPPQRQITSGNQKRQLRRR